MKTSKSETIIQNNVIIGIKVSKFNDNVKDDEFVIPVVNVKNGEASREKANNIIKQVNRQMGSKFMRPSYSVIGGCYQNSHKVK